MKTIERDDSAEGVVRRKVEGIILPFVWVAYAWSPNQERWYLLAFIRTQKLRLTPKRLKKLRERFGIPARVVIRYRELFAAAAFPELDGDPTIAYGLRRHRDRKRYAPDAKASKKTFPRPNVFPKKRTSHRA